MTESKPLAIIPRTVDEVRTLAAMFAKSALLPPDLRGKEADVFVSIMAGQELGLPPMAALRGVHVVKGKPVLAADTMVGIVLGSGLAEYFCCAEETPEGVTYVTKRRGSPHEQRASWTLEDAHRAGLAGDNWKKYPRAMLKARCKAALARDVYPDVLAGCYDEDEAQSFAREPAVLDVSAVVAPVPAPTRSRVEPDPPPSAKAQEVREQIDAIEAEVLDPRDFSVPMSVREQLQVQIEEATTKEAVRKLAEENRLACERGELTKAESGALRDLAAGKYRGLKE